MSPPPTATPQAWPPPAGPASRHGLRFDPGFWRGRRVLVTGHTGFKGTWLCACLGRLGAVVSGFALAPDDDRSPYSVVRPEIAGERIGDIRDRALVDDTLRSAEPEIVIHMAAQPLVRLSYAEPIETFSVNVMGTANVLDSVRRAPSVRAVVVVTTDKVYENSETGRPFAERDRLGGHDPYSSSKACAEIVAASFRSSFFGRADSPWVTTARAGNVVGGGDMSADRLIPDLVRALAAGAPVRLRHPNSVRPWLHVLEPLLGYLALAQHAIEHAGDGIDALNLAPDAASSRTVAEVVECFSAEFGGRPGWLLETGEHPREANLLTLDATAARQLLGWSTLLDFETTVSWTADWYRERLAGGDARAVTFDQVDRYLTLAADLGRATSPGRQRAG